MKKLSPACILIIALLLTACNKSTGPSVSDLKGISVDSVNIKRYEQQLFEAEPENLLPFLQAIQPDYGIFLGADLSDSNNILQLYKYVSDKYLRDIYHECNKAYKDLAFIKEGLEKAFLYQKYYFSDWVQPEVYTYVSGIDYDNPTMYDGRHLLIALDMYLGPDFYAYKDFKLPLYRTRHFTSEYILRDCMEAIALTYIPLELSSDDLLSNMILQAKAYYYLDCILPELPDHIKIAYTPEQLQWCVDHEYEIWAFLIENELLFETEPNVLRTFIGEGPFTKGFQGSPARIATWTGWQIIRSFMDKHKDISLEQLLAMNDYRKILEESSYKPRR